MWVGGRHALPPETAALPPNVAPGIEMGNATGLGGGAQPAPAHQGTPSPETFLALLVSLILILVPIIVIYLYSSGRVIHRLRTSRRPGRPAGDELLGRYTYEGLRKAVRQLYVEMVSRLKGLAADLAPGYTPRQVERVAVRLGLAKPGLARLYEEYIYSPREPRPRDVEEFRRHLSLE